MIFQGDRYAINLPTEWIVVALMRQTRHDHRGSDQYTFERFDIEKLVEDESLLLTETIKHPYEHRDPYHPRPISDNFKGLFRAIDTGNEGSMIPAYNGGLFALDRRLDNLSLTDEVCGYFSDLADYHFRPASTVSEETDRAGKLIDVDILGHIFEQSITDLERIRNELDGREHSKPRRSATPQSLTLDR